ncbi:hypothetical protein C8J57DRAFT_1645298 [Mycena rebaudengoi]|nr:hypothetical protein C8J57DRAFT_1645298 [Mycena rebaudengoi]
MRYTSAFLALVAATAVNAATLLSRRDINIGLISTAGGIAPDVDRGSFSDAGRLLCKGAKVVVSFDNSTRPLTPKLDVNLMYMTPAVDTDRAANIFTISCIDHKGVIKMLYLKKPIAEGSELVTYVPAKNNGTLDESNIGYRFTFTLVEFFQRPIFGKLVYLYTICGRGPNKKKCFCADRTTGAVSIRALNMSDPFCKWSLDMFTPPQGDPIATAAAAIAKQQGTTGIGAAVGSCLCFMDLLLIGILYARPSTRRYLDRVSFRLMIYALTVYMIHGIALACSSLAATNSPSCEPIVWLVMFTLQIGSWLIFGIALNLQLVLVHRVNGHSMEKFYITGACVIAICVTIPPLVANQYGWDPLNETCWIKTENPATRLHWQLATQSVWTLLAVTGETLAFFVVVFYILWHKRTTRGLTASDAKLKTINYASQYRFIIIRISLYPIFSVVINTITVLGDIYLSLTGPINSDLDFQMDLLNNLIFGLRPALYCPSRDALLRAVRLRIALVMTTTEKVLPGARGTSTEKRFSKNSAISNKSSITTSDHPEALERIAARQRRETKAAEDLEREERMDFTTQI